MTDKSKNTGTGGINIDGKVYTTDVGVPDNLGGPQGNYSSGDIDVDKTTKDISKPTKETFAKYLSNSTLAKIGESARPNVYPVGSGDQTQVRPTALRDERGYPVRPALSPNDANFSPEFSSGIGAPAPLPLKKGLSSVSGPDGNELLPNATQKSSGADFSISAGINFSTSGIGFDLSVLGGGISYTKLQEPIKSYTDGALDKNLYKNELAVPSFRFFDTPLFGFYGPMALRKPIKILDDGTFENLASDPIIRTITGHTAVEKAMDEVAGENYVPGGIANSYAPSSGFFEFNKTITLVDGDGYPISPGNAQQNGEDFEFAKRLPTAYSNDFTKSKLKVLLRRGKAPGDGPDGHTLLRQGNIETLEKDNKPHDYVENYVGHVLENNRFNPLSQEDKKFFAKDYLSLKFFTNENDLSTYPAPTQLTFGKSLGNDTQYVGTKRTLGIRKLSRIAPILQDRSRLGYSDNTDAPQGNVGLEGFNQPLTKLDVKDIISDLVEGRIDSELDIEGLAEGKDYGLKDDRSKNDIVDLGSTFETTINTVVNKFTGISNESQIATAAALLVAVLAAYRASIQGLEGNISLGSGPTMVALEHQKVYGRSGMGTYLGGRYTSLSDFNMAVIKGSDPSKNLRFYGIRPTKKPFALAVLIGMCVFFEINQNNGEVSLLAPVLDPNVSHKIILARSIIRAAARLTVLLSQINSEQLTGAKIGAPPGYEVLKAQRESRLFSIFNFFANIGDIGSTDLVANPENPKIIFDEQIQAYTFEPAISDVLSNDVTILNHDAGRKISSSDTAAIGGINKDNFYGTSRKFSASGGNTKVNKKLAWATDQAPGVMSVINDFSRTLSHELYGPPGRTKKAGDSSNSREISLPQESKRMSPKLVSEIESRFDSEYVPFYFHDIRTNEIIGFHAFISSLSDDYSVSYESVDGFGRIEPIKIYKNTLRKIGFSFIVAALDEEDLRTMWTKINKLTMMVYPQYTSGRRISITNESDPNGEFDFVKPFTQAISAAPLVRIRLGNLLSSNYSRFNLSKIFGLHENDTLIAGLDRTGQIARNRATEKRDNKIREAKRRTAIAQGRFTSAMAATRGVNPYQPKFDWVLADQATLYPIKNSTVPAPNNAQSSKNQPAKDQAKDQNKQKTTTQTGQTGQPATTQAKSTWSLQLASARGVAWNLTGKFFSDMYLVCNVEAVFKIPEGQTLDDILARLVSAQDTEAGGLELDSSFASVDTDPLADAIFRVSLKKVPIALAVEEQKRDWEDQTLAQDLSFSRSDQLTPDQEEQARIYLGEQWKRENGPREQADLVSRCQNGHRRYDALLARGLVPDITKYKFILTRSELKKLTHYSNRVYVEELKGLIKNQDEAEAISKKVAEQEATDIREAEDDYAKRAGELPSTELEAERQYLDKASQFMSAKNNSIVKSFATTGGSGLAGFIESMSYDWMAGTWEIGDALQPDSQVPKLCKITIGFSPVHDIPPGLDSDGYNRAPIYPVLDDRSIKR